MSRIQPCADENTTTPSVSQHDIVGASHLRLPFLPMASSKAETILISSSGDVLSCRCRNSPYPTKKEVQAKPYKWTDDVAILCCDATVSGDEINPSICSLWNGSSSNKNNKARRFNGSNGGGLLGGSPAEVASPLHHFHERERGGSTSPHLYSGGPPPTKFQQPHKSSSPSQPTKFSPITRMDEIRNSSLAATTDYDDEGALVPIMSFDYSQTYDGSTDVTSMSTSLSGTHLDSSRKENEPDFLHGIPSFSSFFSNVKIRQVSAHPLGAHVLLISQAGLLYSYGLNTHGQLGIGILSDTRSSDQGYIMTPTIVTPLVENGGKAVQCAAGVNHSLVVVETEEQRLVKSRSFDQSKNQFSSSHRSLSQDDMRSEYRKTEAVVYHQMYGFGRNNFMKIGLVSPKMAKRGTRPNYSEDEMECVILPRRVALHCSVKRRFRKEDNTTVAVPMGIFMIDASVDHSAALVRRTSGDVELYTWGSAMCGALGLPHPAQQHQQPVLEDILQASRSTSTVRVVPVPSFVACLSKTSNVDAQTASLLLNDVGEYPVDVSLGRGCSFVVTSTGRCFSFGTSDDGMLGLGRDIKECHQPTEIQMPEGSRLDKIKSVSAGAAHVVACTTSGNAFAWGIQSHVGLEVVVRQPTTPSHTTVTPVHARRPSLGQASSTRENPLRIEWSPKQVKIPVVPFNLCTQTTELPLLQITQACAGSDCSFFISESGKVFSTGMNSGRLGRGELEGHVAPPSPLFGGLHLFKNQSDVL